MLKAYLTLIFLYALINYSSGENAQHGIFIPLREAEGMPSAWKTDLTKRFIDELGMEINKLKENFENRFQKVCEVKLEKNFRSRLESELKDTLRNKLKSKLENLRNTLESKLEKNLRNTLESKLEGNFKNKLDSKLEASLEKKLQETLERALENLENKFEKKQNMSQREVWIKTPLKDAISLNGRAVIAGYESDGSPLWIVMGKIEYENIVFGKLNPVQQYGHLANFQDKSSYYYALTSIHVLCAPPEKMQWVECRNDYVPPNAFVGGGSYNGEKVYVGRAREEDALIPGWVIPSGKVLNIVYNKESKTHNTYEVLCLV